MISDDLSNLADRMAGHALHNTAPTREELAAFQRAVEASKQRGRKAA